MPGRYVNRILIVTRAGATRDEYDDPEDAPFFHSIISTLVLVVLLVLSNVHPRFSCSRYANALDRDTAARWCWVRAQLILHSRLIDFLEEEEEEEQNYREANVHAAKLFPFAFAFVSLAITL